MPLRLSPALFLPSLAILFVTLCAGSPALATQNGVASWGGDWESDMPGEPRTGYIETSYREAKDGVPRSCWYSYADCSAPHSECLHFPARRERHPSWSSSYIDLETDGFRSRVYGRLAHYEANGAGQEQRGLTSVKWINFCAATPSRAAVRGRSGVRVSLTHGDAFGAAVALQLFRSKFLSAEGSLPRSRVTMLGLTTKVRPHVAQLSFRFNMFQLTIPLRVYVRRSYSYEQLLHPNWRPRLCSSVVDFGTEVLLYGELEGSARSFFYTPPSEVKLYSWTRLSVELGLAACTP